MISLETGLKISSALCGVALVIWALLTPKETDDDESGGDA